MQAASDSPWGRGWRAWVLAVLWGVSGGACCGAEDKPAAEQAMPAAATLRTLRDPAAGPFHLDNLVAWCIVPFDSQHRTPAERAEMLNELGIRRLAYDYRAEHIPTFSDEIAQLRKHQIELFAWWFPTVLNDEARMILELLEKEQIKTQLWVMGGDPPGATQEEKVAAEVARLRPICEAAARIGCQVGLYNHGGWFGDPDNQLSILASMNMPNVGIVYNLHHGHDRLDQFAPLLQRMQPHLICLNLNGMATDGEARGLKILPISAGDRDREWLEVIRRSGYRGPIGILNHTDEDARLRLIDNLDGLARLIASPDSQTPLPPHEFRSWKPPAAPANDGASHATVPDERLVRTLLEAARHAGDPQRGLAIYAGATTACHSCHRVGTAGGTVGPELSTTVRRRTPEQLVASLLWPDLEVEACYRATQIATTDGRILKGYLVDDGPASIALRDPATGTEQRIARDEIEQFQAGGSLMPSGLMNSLSEVQQADLVRWLIDLQTLPEDQLAGLALAAEHAIQPKPAEFDVQRPPLEPETRPSWQADVNRARIYDFYAKQADHFRTAEPRPTLLAEFPGLDGPGHGHWGNQNEETWRRTRWQQTDHGSLLSGVLHLAGAVIPRAVCVRVGEAGERSLAFDPDQLDFVAAWRDGFVQISEVRHGFLDGLRPGGPLVEMPKLPKLDGHTRRYLGFYRHGPRTIFAYQIDAVDYLDGVWYEDGEIVRQRGPRAQHPWRWMTETGQAQWPQKLVTEIRFDPSPDAPYAIDTIELPRDNPWRTAIYCGDHDFASDGTAYVGTMTGDVWSVRGFAWDPLSRPDSSSPRATWRRFASGLHHVLGIVVEDDQVFVLGRDQITRLRDTDGDGEADYYESFSRAYVTSPAGHDFICGLQRDRAGRFYTASGNQGILQIAADGQAVQVLATGFRNPDGICLMSDGTITVPCSEGEWTPASMVCAVRPVGKDPAIRGYEYSLQPPPFFGYGGPTADRSVQLPMVYLPRGIDNSSGAQIEVTSDRWGPLAGQWLHLSFGAGTYMLLLRDLVAGQLQGAVVPMPGEFLSGVHRGRFHPRDGQLYLSGMAGWGSYTTDEGCLQRVRYTGKPVQLPIGWRAHQNGLAIHFSQPLDPTIAGDLTNHFAQAWNYRYSAAYGSAEYSARHPGMRGHDVVEFSRAIILNDGKTLFLESLHLQPVNQLHLRLRVGPGRPVDLFATIHELAEPLVDIPEYRARSVPIAAHPLQSDLQMALYRVPNPWRQPLPDARPVRMEAGSNLSFVTREFHVSVGEPIALTLVNPDVVPHNWALLRPGTLSTVGELANRLIGEPEATARHYIPETDDVLHYVDIVDPGMEQTIYFRAPERPGIYPYLCTFPGHWMVMNGQMVVHGQLE